jgi:hypothetical protein
MTDRIEREIARLADLDLQELRSEWRQRYRTRPPLSRTADALRRFLAGRIQEDVHGGLSAETRRRLRRTAASFERDQAYTPSSILDLKPGTLLSREWGGVQHRVRVLDDGFEYGDERYDNLSAVARCITGARWSGPLFFGLRTRSGHKP